MVSLFGCSSVPDVRSNARVEQPGKLISKLPQSAPKAKIRRIPPPKEQFRVRRYQKGKPFRIFLDAGHGGHDDGAQGFYGASEKNIVLDLSKWVRNALMQKLSSRRSDVLIKLSRQSDKFLPLRERVRQANAWGANVFISIHANASVYKTPRGFELYFLNSEPSDADTRLLTQMENQGDLDESLDSDILNILSDVSTMAHIEQSSQLAEVLYETMSRTLIANKRAVKQGPFTVLSGTQMPAVLVEIGYVTNKLDAKNLTSSDYLKKAADAISMGIIQYYQYRQTQLMG